MVHLFEGSGGDWALVRTLAAGFGAPGGADGQLSVPHGLRFAVDGVGLAVADYGNDRLCLFNVEDGSFMHPMAEGMLVPYDVEQCVGGWLALSSTLQAIAYVDDMDTEASWAGGDLHDPTALAIVPGVGLAVRSAQRGGLVTFRASPDALAMASMSAARVGWMVAVARGALQWHHLKLLDS